MKKALFLLLAAAVLFMHAEGASFAQTSSGGDAGSMSLPASENYGVGNAEDRSPGSELDNAEFPVVYYLFYGKRRISEAMKHLEVEERFAKGVTLPVYVGYLVVDEDYAFRFVDKSDGLCPSLEQRFNQLNDIDKKGFYYPPNSPGSVLRWTRSGCEAILREEIPQFADESYALYGREPLDDFVPEYEAIFNTDLKNLYYVPDSFKINVLNLDPAPHAPVPGAPMVFTNAAPVREDGDSYRALNTFPYKNYGSDNIEDHPLGTKPDYVGFPIVHYLFYNGKFLEKALERPEARERFANGLTLPVYAGYLVVDEDYAIRFVDKSNGLFPDLAQRFKQLNDIDKKGFYYPPNAASNLRRVPRWSWRGYDAIWHEEIRHGIADKVYTTYGREPIDDLVPEYQRIYQSPNAGEYSWFGLPEIKVLNLEFPPYRPEKPDWIYSSAGRTPEWLWSFMVADSRLYFGDTFWTWERITGRIDDIFTNSSGDTVLVFHASCWGLFRIYCQIPAKRADAVKHLRPGMEVDLSGYVYNVVSSHIFMVNCWVGEHVEKNGGRGNGNN